MIFQQIFIFVVCVLAALLKIFFSYAFNFSLFRQFLRTATIISIYEKGDKTIISIQIFHSLRKNKFKKEIKLF